MKPQQIPKLTLKDIGRFAAQIKYGRTRECWPFIGGHDQQGYGLFYVGHQKHRAHRIGWVIANGSIPEGINVLHKCDNPPCCNPDHLKLGTHAENMEDMAVKGRGTQGTKSWTAILSEADVVSIRSRYVKRVCGCPKLAKEFGVHPTTVDAIIKGRSWKYLHTASSSSYSSSSS